MITKSKIDELQDKIGEYLDLLLSMKKTNTKLLKTLDDSLRVGGGGYELSTELFKLWKKTVNDGFDEFKQPINDIYINATYLKQAFEKFKNDQTYQESFENEYHRINNIIESNVPDLRIVERRLKQAEKIISNYKKDTIESQNPTKLKLISNSIKNIFNKLLGKEKTEITKPDYSETKAKIKSTMEQVNKIVANKENCREF